MRILLTGKSGQLGWELHKRLEHDFQLLAFGRDDLDFRDARRLHDMLKRLPDLSLIVNAAAYTDVDRAEHEPLITELINTEVPTILAAEADRRGIPMIHFSTDYVFDGQREGVASCRELPLRHQQHARDTRLFSVVNNMSDMNPMDIKPYTEQETPRPLSIYGRSKLAGELRVKEHCMKYLVFRLAGLYGNRRKNFLTTMLQYVNSGKRPRVVNDQIVSPNWCPMVADAVEHLIRRMADGGKTPWGIYHLSGTGSTSWYEFARVIFDKYARIWKKRYIEPIPVSSGEYQAAARRPAYSVLDSTKFETTFEYTVPDWETQFLYCINHLEIPS